MLNFTFVSLYMMVAAANGADIPGVVVDMAEASKPTVEVVQVVEEKTSKPAFTEADVRKYFVNQPLLAEIARCESTFRHYDKDGNVLRGRVNGADVGVMQINEKYHLERAVKLGLDIYTPEGNMAYARYLYEKQGAQPWIASSKCWAKVAKI